MSTHQIQLITRDGQSLSFDCADSEDLISAAARASIHLPALCKGGGCGACRASCTDGDYHLGETSREALSDQARGRGEVLLCRTYADGDLAIAAPFDHAHISFQPVPERTGRVSALTQIGGNTVRLVVQYDEDPELGVAAQFEPGQYVELIVPESGLTRAYSLANTANWDGRLEFLIRLHPTGQFSAWLRDTAATGSAIGVRGPQGAFVLQDNGTRPRIFVAGGTGLAPMLSMLSRMAEYGESNPCRLVFGVTRASDLFALDDIERLKRALPALSVDIRLWEGGGDAGTQPGTPVEGLKHCLNDAPQADIYLCGPPAMIDAAEQVALAAGVPAARIFSERFLPT